MDLVGAAAAGNLEQVNRLIAEGRNLNEVNYRGTTPLFAAIIHGHLDVMNRLIEAGADINFDRGDSVNALMIASMYNKPELVDRLIEAGARVNDKDEEELSALHEACKYGYIDVVNRLIEAGASINDKDKDGLTPLHYACKNGYIDVVNRLIDAGAIILEIDDEGLTPLHHASMQGHADIVNLLISAERLIEKDPRALSGIIFISKFDTSSSLNFPNKKGLTPLHYAVMRGHLNVVRNLIKGGADPNLTFDSNPTPFRIADAELQKILLTSDKITNEQFSDLVASIDSRLTHDDIMEVMRMRTQRRKFTIPGFARVQIENQNGGRRRKSMKYRSNKRKTVRRRK